MINYEVESKMQVEQEDFENLLELGTVHKKTEQLNVYYDEEQERLSQASATFRVRLFSSPEVPVMTLKVPVRSDTGPRTCLEIEKELGDEHQTKARMREMDVEQDLPSEFASELRRLEIRHLKRTGCMRTSRSSVNFSEDLEMQMDRVCLPDGEVFFEIEFESSDSGQHEKAISFIRSVAQSACPSRLSKYERFMRALKGKPAKSL